MKKLLLLLASGGFAISAIAQSATSNSILFSGKNRTVGIDKANNISGETAQFNTNRSDVARKGTLTPDPRWYSIYDYYLELTGGVNTTFSRRVSPIWFDSTVVVNYSNGTAPINYSSVAQVFDPISNASIFNSTFLNYGELNVQRDLPYKVDSLYIVGGYARKTGRPNIVDTLIISVAAVSNSNYYFLRSSTTGNYGQYLPSGRDTLFAPAPDSDPINRVAITDATGATTLTWKVPLTSADGEIDQETGSYTTKAYGFQVPNGGYTVPAGYRVAVSYTFKTGETSWNYNVDSVNMFNRFMPVFAEANAGSAMPYHWYDLGDRNGLAMMFSTSPDRYSPVVFIEAWNTNNFGNEFLNSGIKISCAGCAGVSVNDVKNTVNVGNPFPNPANNTISLPITMKESANVNVTLSNMVGQVMATQNLGMVNANVSKNATFSTAGIANGVYFLTVEANGARSTTRFVVAH